MVYVQAPAKLRRRKVIEDVSLPIVLPSLLRRIYASRGVRSARDIERSIKSILCWKELNGINNAVSMLYTALRKDMRIAIVGDFDTDGATSIALSVLCLRAFGCNNIIYMIPNRFEHGYGLSLEMVNQAKIRGAQMIITVDNGISSHTGVDHAHTLGIPVLITDHHLPSNILPEADAIVNPNLFCCNFSLQSLAGVGVTFYLMVALRALLRDKNWFEYRGITMPNLAEYLDLVALGTVVDMVPLNSNNRILIWQGLNRIRMGRCRPGIKALMEVSKRNPLKLVASDLSFFLGPRINAAGRLDNMSKGVELLLCNDLDEARVLANELNALNQIRKEIEQRMQYEALILCNKLERSNNGLPLGLTIYHPKWHEGVIGILASRIRERFNRPVIAFAPAKMGMLKGSGRSIQGLHMYDALEYISTLHPDLMIKFGGHEMAVGLLLEETKFNIFQYLFDKLVSEWVDPNFLCNELISDGELDPSEMTIETAQLLQDAGPWGQMFPEPLFDGQFRLLKQRIIGGSHLEVRVESINGGPILTGIAFNIDTNIWPKNSVNKVKLAYKLNINEFRGKSSLQIIIDYIWTL